MPQIFRAEQWLPYPIETVFAFFGAPANLPRLMPRWQRARIEQAQIEPPSERPAGTPVLPGTIAGAGTRMTLTFRAVPLLPLRLPWDALISEFRWNEHFCDVIDGRGPFRTWRHCHWLHTALNPKPGLMRRARTGTLLVDQVEYTLPFGLLGRLANAVAVRRQIAGVFRYRHRMTTELLKAYAAQLPR